ncbi:ImmA/IrrE family metallo-endopeptidase [Acinetobacter baumannii]|uniref:ImmA/IrrE family metallo-endopeptidase n=1 Tax=Acinetobacter baumannii TaxID=470 RepID=UPI00135F411B|nr:ImmA/IrrE family metallo-endopeptidase [Acinetobacter baumannii]ELB1534010.1 ImmA/IrrE family metallo-endopeptidase [Acinetobacter baumannii]CAA0247524.1 phage related protein [Acinetobacter baumannii]
MNTKKKGDAFENFVFDYFSILLRKGYLGINPNQAKIYKQKKYYSKDREGYIIFDVAIEVSFFEQEDPFLVILIECKDYGKKVPVDDIEEFSTKVSQVGKHNTKAICITKNGFQKGALKIAKNRNIGLWKITTNDNHKVIFNRTINRIKNNDEIISNALTSENFQDISATNIFIQTPLRFTSIPKDLIYDFLSLQKDVSPKEFFTQHRVNSYSKTIPYKSKKELSILAENLFDKFYKNDEIDLNEIINTLGYKLIEIDTPEHPNIIGKLETKLKTITIFGSGFFSQHQINFAKAHEIAHIFLKHSNYIISESFSPAMESHSLDIEITQNIDRLEFQANYFAGCLLLPENRLKATLNYYLQQYGIRNRGFSPLYIDSQPCNFENYRRIILPLTEIFNVSQETMKIRLTELGLAQFAFKPTSTNKVKRSYIDRF